MIRPTPWIPSLLAALLLAPLSACGGGDDGTPAPLPAFRITSSSPAVDELYVALDTDVTVTFSKSLDPNTVTNIGLVVTGGGGAVPGSAAVVDDGQGRTLRWTGQALFEPDQLHTCRLHGALRSVDGDVVGGRTSFNFRSIPTGAPSFLPRLTQLQQTFGNLVTGRQDHRATLLADGRVLVTGGFTQGAAVTDRAELYNPATRTFAEVGARMVSERASHTATLLEDGRVLLCGGWFEPTLGTVLVTQTAELYSPATGGFTPVGNMTKPRTAHAALRLPDGRVLVTGGSRLDGTFLTDFDDAEVFDPDTLAFTEHPERLLHTRSSHGMVDTGLARFVLAGGSDLDLRTSWYDTARDRFVDMGTAFGDSVRFGPAVAAFQSGAVAVAGGDDSGTVLHVDALTGVLRNTGSGLNGARSYATASPIAPDRMLVAGGIDFSRGSFLEASCDLIVEGGVGGSVTYGTEVRFPHGMAWHSATVLVSGDVLFCGGLSADGTQPNHTEAFLFLVDP